MPTRRSERLAPRGAKCWLGIALLGLILACPVRAAAPDVKSLPRSIEGNAVWYDVPKESLARKRAGKDELTAAHNRLPFGTKIRVTHLKNKKSVVVRVTDRGIKIRSAVIDLCREAAEKLDMVKEGSARVRLEILPDELKTSTKW